MGLWNKIWNKDKKVLVVNPATETPAAPVAGPTRKYKGTVYMWPSGERGQFIKAEVEQGRNRPCPCGSGKKYKKCCLERKNAPHREMVTAARLKTEKGI